MANAHDDVETYIDCAGKLRQFRVFEWETPVGWFLRAEELTDGEPTGFTLTEPVGDGEVPPFYVLRERIRERMARRNFVRHPNSGQVEAIAGRIRGQVV